MSAADHRARVRQRLILRLALARAQTDRMFAALDESSLYERPIAERHRIVFYVGHLEAFDWNLLRVWHPAAASVNASFDRLFAFGIDPPEGQLPNDPPHAWPALPELRHYVAAIRERLDGWIAAIDPGHPGPWVGTGADPACLLNAAIEHRLMHAETLAYMLHRLPPGMLSEAAWGDSTASPSPRPADAAPLEHDAVPIPAGEALVGLRRDASAIFGWDNEYAQQAVAVPAFAIDRRMVSNGQFLRFVDAGGYDNPAWWEAGDWDWIRTQGIAHPGFWSRDGQAWHWRTPWRQIALPLDWPVYVSQAEAGAYARWAGKALPSEAQWLRAASGTPQRTLTLGDDYHEPLGPQAGNFDFRLWDPEPVHAPGPLSDFGVAGLWGNGWEWTSTPFAPAAGFEPFAFYRGYSQDFFDGQHVVLKGGSPRTAACIMRPSFRNWFRPRYRHVYAGFRCVTTPRH